MSGIAVYASINAVSSELSHDGISKSRQATGFATYKFRGIDEVMNALAPLLVKHKLIIVPRILERECVERQSSKGNVLFSVTVAAEFDFISAEDGSKVTARTYGEAMDSGDKATNKAMAIAYKYAAFQTFCIPTEGSGDTDADATVHEPIKPKEAAKPQASKPAENPIKSNAPNEAAASVPAASSPPPIKPPSRADAVPTVAPAKPHPESWKERERAQLSKGAADVLLGGTDGNGGLKFIIDAIGVCKVEIVETQFSEWRKRADKSWKHIVDADKERITTAVQGYKAALAIAQAAESMSALSKGDDYDRETGELREAAE